MSVFLLMTVFRRLGWRGLAIAWVATLALAIALIVGLLSWAIPHAQSSANPSPSTAVLAVARNDPQAEAAVHEGVSARAGAVIWSKPIPASVDSVARADGVYYTAGINTDHVYAITAYRMSDGAQLWSVGPPSFTQAQSPLLVAHGLLFYYSGNSASNWAIYALDVTTHTLAWHATVPNGGYPWIAVNADMLFVSTLSGSPLQPDLDITAFRLRDGALVWRQTALRQSNVEYRGPAQGDVRQLVAGPDAVYLADGTGAVVALRQSDGAVVWRSQRTTNKASAIQLTYSGSTLYECMTPNTGEQRALVALDPAKGGVHWRVASSTCWGNLIEMNGVVYLAEQDLVARRASDGSVLWRVSPVSGALGFLSLQVDSGVVIAAASVIDQSRTGCSPGLDNPCRYTGYLAAFNAASGAPYWHVDVNDNPLLISDAWFIQSIPEFVG